VHDCGDTTDGRGQGGPVDEITDHLLVRARRGMPVYETTAPPTVLCEGVQKPSADESRPTRDEHDAA
jgi:hypothetical protein